MLVTEKKFFMFDVKEEHFSISSFNIDGCDSVLFELCKNNVNSE